MINKKLLYPLLTVVALLIFGMYFYNYVENWSYTDSFYFSTMTLTTVGYGDLTPTTHFSKIFTSFYALVGISAMFYLLGSSFKFFLFEEKLFGKVFSTLHRIRYHETQLKKLKKDVEEVEDDVEDVEKEVKVVNKKLKNKSKNKNKKK